MFSIVIFLLLSSVKAQFYSQQQQQYPYNNYNQWSSYPQNYPLWNQGVQQQNQARVRGNLLSADSSQLPYGSQIIVSLADVSLQDVASRPLNTLVLYGSYRFPIAFDIPYSIAQVQMNSNNVRQYAIQARIELNGQLLYINDQYTPVQLIPPPTNPINVYMKSIGASNIPGGINNMFSCQHMPDAGPCKAYIEQFYFNTQTGFCQVFIYGGCEGNPNRFNSRDECERTCAQYRRKIIRNNAKQKWIR